MIGQKKYAIFGKYGTVPPLVNNYLIYFGQVNIMSNIVSTILSNKCLLVSNIVSSIVSNIVSDIVSNIVSTSV